MRCDECGAEIVFVKPCPCPARDPKSHMDICCNEEMRSLGVEPAAKKTAGERSGSPGPSR